MQKHNTRQELASLCSPNAALYQLLLSVVSRAMWKVLFVSARNESMLDRFLDYLVHLLRLGLFNGIDYH
jgi:hypothetical protein